MTCLNCDQPLISGEVVLSGEFRGERFNIAMPGIKCERCGYSTIHGRDSAAFSKKLADAYRSRHGLLTSDEIKVARLRIGKSQSEFATYLRVGVASVKRWESGQVQDEAMDELIRLKTDLWAAEQNVRAVRGTLSAQGPYSVMTYVGSEDQTDAIILIETKTYSHESVDMMFRLGDLARFPEAASKDVYSFKYTPSKKIEVRGKKDKHGKEVAA